MKLATCSSWRELSNNASGAFIKQMGAHARGMIVTQVFPYERASGPRFVRQALEFAKAHKGMATLSPAMSLAKCGASSNK